MFLRFKTWSNTAGISLFYPISSQIGCECHTERDSQSSLITLFSFFKLYKLNIHNVVAEFVPLIMNTIIIQVSAQAR